MTEELTPDAQALALQTVALAVGAAGVLDNPVAWRNRVLTAVGDIGAMLRPNSDAVQIAAKINQSDTFRATYIGYEEEFGKTDGKPSERPTRLIVKTQSDMAIKNDPGKDGHNPEGFEYTRTEPLWTVSGRMTRKRLEELPSGSIITVYKFTEQIGQNKKVRVLTHFDIVRLATGQGVRASFPAAPVQVPVEAASTPHAATPPEQGSPDDNAGITAIEKGVDALSTRQRISFSRACRAEGFDDFMLPAPENMARVLELLTEAAAV